MSNMDMFKEWGIDIVELTLEAFCENAAEKGLILTDEQKESYRQQIISTFNENNKK